MKKYFLLFLICIHYSILYSQNAVIEGYVLDKNKDPLIGAYIYQNDNPITATNKNGYFKIEIKPNVLQIIKCSFVGYDTSSIELKLPAGKKENINFTLFSKTKNIKEFIISEKKRQKETSISINPKTVFSIASPNTSIEKTLLFQALGVSSNNELSSQYNVRGGNFDENLIYVNDVQIYRSFLVRSGQQEGLSFVNPYLTKSVEFSSGGFEAKYGDKMSSVMNVTYQIPKKIFSGAVSGSLLGTNLFISNSSKNNRFRQIHGFRYKTNQYVLKSLDTQGDYKPKFTDYQSLIEYDISKKWKVSFLLNYSNNIYRFIPQNRQTNFGTINEALRLNIYFEGREINQFQNFLGSSTIHFTPNKTILLKLITSSWWMHENEIYDVEGAYRLSELEKDLGSDNFANIAKDRGIGGFLNHARNYLTARVNAIEHKGRFYGELTTIDWGAKLQQENINDEFKEWRYLDSAGYNLPHSSENIKLYSLIKANNITISNRVMLYSQIKKHFIFDSSKLTLNIGGRINYWDFNQQLVGGPRISASYIPKFNNNIVFRAAWGYYHQPPFYREMRNLYGKINRNIKAQTSIHYILAGDYYFIWKDREFKLTSELYYKQLKNLIPYEIDNVRLRYYAKNNAIGRSMGFDIKFNGELVKGAESWVSIGVLSSKEDLKDDFYYKRYNASGQLIIPGYTFDQVATDSVKVTPGFIPRPTDQRFKFAFFFQDYIPGNKNIRINLSFIFATGLPHGPPSFERYKDTLRIPAYRRVDLGLSAKLFSKDKEKIKKIGNKSWTKLINEMWLSFEIFNMLKINNTISYLWIRDVNDRQYAVPNFLTSRLLNLKLQITF